MPSSMISDQIKWRIKILEKKVPMQEDYEYMKKEQ
jgi:hypothetical protein